MTVASVAFALAPTVWMLEAVGPVSAAASSLLGPVLGAAAVSRFARSSRRLRASRRRRPVARTLTALLFGVLSVLAAFALDRAGWGVVGVAAIFLLAAAVQAMASRAVGRLADQRGRLPPLRAGLAAAVATSFALAIVDGRWTLAALVAAASISYGVFWTPGVAPSPTAWTRRRSTRGSASRS